MPGARASLTRHSIYLKKPIGARLARFARAALAKDLSGSGLMAGHDQTRRGRRAVRLPRRGWSTDPASPLVVSDFYGALGDPAGAARRASESAPPSSPVPGALLL